MLIHMALNIGPDKNCKVKGDIPEEDDEDDSDKEAGKNEDINEIQSPLPSPDPIMGEEDSPLQASYFNDNMEATEQTLIEGDSESPLFLTAQDTEIVEKPFL